MQLSFMDRQEGWGWSGWVPCLNLGSQPLLVLGQVFKQAGQARGDDVLGGLWEFYLGLPRPPLTGSPLWSSLILVQWHSVKAWREGAYITGESAVTRHRVTAPCPHNVTSSAPLNSRFSSVSCIYIRGFILLLLEISCFDYRVAIKCTAVKPCVCSLYPISGLHRAGWGCDMKWLMCTLMQRISLRTADSPCCQQQQARNPTDQSVTAQAPLPPRPSPVYSPPSHPWFCTVWGPLVLFLTNEVYTTLRS